MPVTIGSGAGGNDATIPNLYVTTVKDANGNNIIQDTTYGQSSSNPASSANELIKRNPAAKDGLYWISMSGGARQTYCMFETNGTGWILAARIQYDDSTVWYWSSANWTNATVFNTTSNAYDEVNIKTYAFTEWGVSTLRLCGSRVNINYMDNSLSFPNGGGFGGNTLRTIFSQGNNSWNSEINMGRGSWMNWVDKTTIARQYEFDNQPNCNEDRINTAYTYAGGRLCWSGNNEGDCNTNDSAIGVGLWRNGLTELGAGALSWPQGDRYPCYAWIWVN
jgi:hypothetical protein